MKLKPFQDTPVESCAACKVWSSDCLVPMGNEAVPMCWLCAHHVTEHDAELYETCVAECECDPSEIYPRLSEGLAS